MRHDDKPDAGDFSVLRARQNGHAVMRRREGDANRLLSDDEHEAIVRRLVAQPAGDGPDRLRALDAHTFPGTFMGDSRFASGLYADAPKMLAEFPQSLMQQARPGDVAEIRMNHGNPVYVLHRAMERRPPFLARVRTLLGKFFGRLAR